MAAYRRGRVAAKEAERGSRETQQSMEAKARRSVSRDPTNRARRAMHYIRAQSSTLGHDFLSEVMAANRPNCALPEAWRSWDSIQQLPSWPFAHELLTPWTMTASWRSLSPRRPTALYWPISRWRDAHREALHDTPPVSDTESITSESSAPCARNAALDLLGILRRDARPYRETSTKGT